MELCGITLQPSLHISVVLELSRWQAKLEFSLRLLCNPSLTVTHVRCVMDVNIKL